MGYFDTIAEATFKMGPNGETIFYPNGAIGKGRVVPDDETRRRLHRQQKNLYKLALFTGVPYGMILGNLGIFTLTSLSPMLLLVIYFLYKQQAMVRGLEKHSLRLGFKEAAHKGLQALPNWYFWMLGSCAILLALLGFYLPVSADKSLSDTMPTVAAIAGFGVMILVMAVALYKLKHANLTRDP